MLLILITDRKIDSDKNDIERWTVINDRVMGGLSSGNVADIDQGFRFYGTVSLENNGALQLSEALKTTITHKNICN